MIRSVFVLAFRLAVEERGSAEWQTPPVDKILEYFRILNIQKEIIVFEMVRCRLTARASEGRWQAVASPHSVVALV